MKKKRINTNNKGNRIQRKAIEELEVSGWLVSKAGQQRGRFTKEKDLFGLFDIVAIKRGTLLLIQLTVNKPHTHKKYIKFSEDFSNEGLEYWQWVWYDRKGWKKFLYRYGEMITYDLRKK